MNRMQRVNRLIATFALGCMIVGAFSILMPVHAASTPPTLNNIQVLVQTTNSNLNYYSLSAYNSSGYQVASATSSYPGFGLELPSATYLITVTATQQGSYYPVPYASTGAVASAPSNSSGPNIVPLPIKAPISEYGYVLQTVNGPVTLNVKTAPFSNVPTTKVHVSVSYVNGTGAKGVWVDASVVGGYYYYGVNNAVLSNQTVAGGSTTLVVPTLPMLLQGYISVPVNAPKSTTTMTTTVGGQPVNITMYWEPNYVELTGTALIIPPQTSAQMTLKVQQQNYILEPGIAQSGVATAAGVSNGVSSSPAPSSSGNNIANSTTPTQIPPFEAQLGAISGTTSSLSTGPVHTNALTLALIGTTITLVVIAAGVALFFRFRKTMP